MSTPQPNSLLIRGGQLVDGTGTRAPFAADLRVRGGVIAEIGPDLKAEAGEQVVDAAGCYVAPGFIEAHTHYDATMWWQPDLDPLPGYGATTIIMGNCGFSAAPVSDDEAARREMVKIFSFFEDIPQTPFLENLPWDWHLWSEYRRSMEAKVRLPANCAAYVGHVALRLATMGLAAWDRAATADEIARMAALLDDALAAGALGLSTNQLDHDGSNRPIPTLLADDAELGALFDVLERHPGTSYQVVIDAFMRKTAPQALERLERLAKGRRLRLLVNSAVPTLDFQQDMREPMLQRVERMWRDGYDLWPSSFHVSPTGALSFHSSLMFAQSNDYVWHEVVLAPTVEEKRRLLADPDWRARARLSWDTKAWAHSPMRNPQRLFLIDSENGTGPIDITLEEYAQSRGLHRSDAMADWVLANGTRSTVHLAPFPKDEALTVRMMTKEKSVGAVSDAGAHLQMLCGGGEHAFLLTRYVRDEKMMTLEQAVHVLTGKLAAFFNLADRGTLAVGKRADITVFNLDEIERRKLEKRWDVPDGKGGTTWRFTRQPAPMRLTLVNGVATFAGGKATGATPGEFLRPVAQAAARAAE
jgi:N-acyl-D-aspartate/D-glutamate deacylase